MRFWASAALPIAAQLAVTSANAATVTSSALGAVEVSSSGAANSGAFYTTTTGGVDTNGVTTRVVTGLSMSANPTVGTITLRAVGTGFDFTYDVTATPYVSIAGAESTNGAIRSTGNAIMTNSNLAGQDRQNMDAPPRTNAGEWEFFRVTVGNVQIADGSSPVEVKGFTAIQITRAGSGNTYEVNLIEAGSDDFIANVIVATEDLDDQNSAWETVGPTAIPAAALGRAVRIEWRFAGDGNAEYDGAYVDDVSVTLPWLTGIRSPTRNPPPVRRWNTGTIFTGLRKSRWTLRASGRLNGW